MKIAFFGTWNFSKNILQGILDSKEIEVSLIVSQPDKPIGRKREVFPTPVKTLAIEKNIPVLQPEKLKNNTDFFNALRNENLDFIIVVAYGKIVPSEVLSAARYGCINIHGSILPAYRGASPIQESIKNWDTKTWLTIMYMSEGMDEGDILKIEKVNINKIDKCEDIFKKFENIGPNLLINTLKEILDWNIAGEKQDESQATYCSKITKQDGEINFKSEQWINIYNKYRAYTSWPWVYTYFEWKKLNIEDCEFIKNNNSWSDIQIGTVLFIDEKQVWILCKDGFLKINKIKLEWKKTMDINSFINGNKNFINYTF